MENITHIYDKMFKKVITLSPRAVVNLINGLFGTAYPPDSTLTYNWTEFEDDKLKKVLADTIITVNNQVSYHIEAQMSEDGTIVFRMFEYGYRHADLNRVGISEEEYRLNFPEPKIIYLYSGRSVPKEYKLWLDFGTQGSFLYRVPVVKLTDLSAEELNQKKLIVLLPFLLLKVRDAMKKERSPENLSALKNLLLNDIIGSIRGNLLAGNITNEDAFLLEDYTKMLYYHLYAQYEGMEEMNKMTDQSFMTEGDLLVEKWEKERDALHTELLEKDEKILKKDQKLSEQEAEIARLKAQLAALQA